MPGDSYKNIKGQCFDTISSYEDESRLTMSDDKEIELLSKREMYALLLKEYEECKDEGRECYLEELIEELRKDLESAGADPL
jgi:hypothetical protein